MTDLKEPETAIRVGDKVWIVHHHHTWDAHDNNQYRPIEAEVVGIEHERGLAHFELNESRPLAECFKTEAQCQQACPDDHPDD